MTTSPASHAGVEHLVPTEVSFADADREALLSRVAAIPATSEMRAMFMTVAPDALRQLADAPEAALATFERWRPTYRKASPFTMIPLREPVGLGLGVAWLLYPELGAIEAFNLYIERAIDLYCRLPALAPLLLACEGDAAMFMELISTNTSMIYSSGTIDLERRGDRHLVLHYDAIPTSALELYVDGFSRGALTSLGHRDHEVTFAPHGPMQAEQTLRW